MAAVRKALVAAAALAVGLRRRALARRRGCRRPGSPRAAGRVGAPIPWAACVPPGEGLQCARIRVPLDWDRPNGRTISLAVIRHLASKPDERIGTLFINPGGPGLSGVDLVQGDPAGFDAIGGGRFDVVSWDPRGTNASTRVRCFRNPRSEAIFWAGDSIPTTNADSERFAGKTADLARRCGEVSGWLLPHISTADTARDLDHLRVLLGEEKLTYVGLSYGTYIGQTYANMFPDRVRAMLLMGIVDAPRSSEGAEARTASDASSADEVFDRFLALCDGAGPERCALAGGGQTAAERVEQLFAQVRRAPIPAPGASPPLVVARGAELRRSAALAVRAAEGSHSVAGERGGARRRARGRRIGARDRGARLHLARGLGRRDDLGGDLLRRRARPAERAGLAAGDRTTRADQPAPGPRAGLVAVGPLRLLAGARARTTTAGPGAPRPRTRSS